MQCKNIEVEGLKKHSHLLINVSTILFNVSTLKSSRYGRSNSIEELSWSFPRSSLVFPDMSVPILGNLHHRVPAVDAIAKSRPESIAKRQFGFLNSKKRKKNLHFHANIFIAPRSPIFFRQLTDSNPIFWDTFCSSKDPPEIRSTCDGVSVRISWLLIP